MYVCMYVCMYGSVAGNHVLIVAHSARKAHTRESMYSVCHVLRTSYEVPGTWYVLCVDGVRMKAHAAFHNKVTNPKSTWYQVRICYYFYTVPYS